MSSHNNPYGGEVESTDNSNGATWRSVELKYRNKDMENDPKGSNAFTIEVSEANDSDVDIIHISDQRNPQSRYFNLPEQTKNMVEAVFRERSKDDKRLFCQAMSQVLDLQGAQAITIQDSKDFEALAKRLGAAIQAKYADQPNGLEQFLDDIQKPALGLPPNNPFKEYEDKCKKRIYDRQYEDASLSIHKNEKGSGALVHSEEITTPSGRVFQKTATMDEETYKAVATAIKTAFADGKVTPEEARQLAAVRRVIGYSCLDSEIDADEKAQIIGVAKKIGAQEKGGRE